MSQQINLLNPAFHKTFDWLTAKPLAIVTCVLLVILVAISNWATLQADSRERAANQRAEKLKTAQDRLLTMSKTIAESKPDPQLANELANALALLKNREEVMKVLEGGTLGNTIGFAEFLRGFARQVPNGLWLTGFTIGAGGNEMEIRGRMLNPASLPEYIRRLKTEKAFQGRSFASLTILRPEEGREKKAVATPAAKAGAPGATTPALPPSFVDFVLMPETTDPGKPASTAPTAPAATPEIPPGLFDAAAMMPNVLNKVTTANEALNNPQKPPEKKP